MATRAQFENSNDIGEPALSLITPMASCSNCVAVQLCSSHRPPLDADSIVHDAGVFAKLTSSYCIVALGGSENFYRSLLPPPRAAVMHAEVTDIA